MSQCNKKDCSNVCPICTEKNCDYITPCNHLFHRDCVNSWINEHNSCPACRSAIDMKKPVKKLCIDSSEEDEKLALNISRQEEEDAENARQFWRLKNQKDEEMMLATFLEIEYFLSKNNQTNS